MQYLGGQAICMYGSLGMSTLSLHSDSTDSLICIVFMYVMIIGQHHHDIMMSS